MTTTPVQRLTELLRMARAVPNINVEAVAPSSIYDALYRTMVLALALNTCGKQAPDGALFISESKLKLAQFVAIHPELVPSLRGWVVAHIDGECPRLDGWARFPRGYAADTLHDKVITYLVATGELRRDRKNIYTRTDGKGLLVSLAQTAEMDQSFGVERHALHELSGMKITLKMLGA